MINLLVVSLWLTFLICLVGFILYNEINKSKKSSLLVQENRRLEMLCLRAENTCNYLKSSNAKKIEEFEEEAKKFRATLITNDDQLESQYLQTLVLQEKVEILESKLKNYKEMYENVSDNLKAAMEESNQKLVTTTEEVIEEWVQYFPVNREYPTILETWVSSLGTIKHIYENRVVYTHYSVEYRIIAFDAVRLPLLVARCFIKPRDENDLVLIIDKEKPVTKNNIVYLDRSEMQFLDNKLFGVIIKRKDYFLASYRQNNLGYYLTIEEAQKVVYNYRKQWLIDNDRVEWLDLWKPNFVE